MGLRSIGVEGPFGGGGVLCCEGGKRARGEGWGGPLCRERGGGGAGDATFEKQMLWCAATHEQQHVLRCRMCRISSCVPTVNQPPTTQPSAAREFTAHTAAANTRGLADKTTKHAACRQHRGACLMPARAGRGTSLPIVKCHCYTCSLPHAQQQSL